MKLYGAGPRAHPAPKVPPETVTAVERAAWAFPALAWLEELVTERRWQRIVLISPPVHITAQAHPGTKAALRETACRDRIVGIATSRGVPLVDFRISSKITREDANYWDPLHYRVGIAERVAAGLGKALATGRDDPGGDWVVRGRMKAAGSD